jgi:hypothetical protein
MRRSVSVFALLSLFSVLALAESFKGRLVDATCYDQQKSATACDPTNASTSFALAVADQAYKLDAAGNAKAAEALKTRADRAADPTKPMSSQVSAQVTGTKDADNTIKVEAIVLQ